MTAPQPTPPGRETGRPGGIRKLLPDLNCKFTQPIYNKEGLVPEAEALHMPFKFSEIQTEQEFRALPEHYQWNHCSSANNLKFIILSTYHPQAVSPHDHDFYELVFVIRGHGTHHWRNRCGDESTMEFGLGDCFAVHPGEIHWYTGCHRLWLFNILLQKTQLEEELAPIRDMANLKQLFDRPEKEPPSKLHIPPEYFPAAVEKINHLVGELSLRAQGYQTVVCNGVIDFLILLGRLHSRPAARNSVRTEIHDAVNAASLYLEQHLTDNLTLEELAGHANMSRAHFCRCFKLVFGSSVWTWLTQRRLELAKQMLATTDLSLKEIAAECGFCSSSYFSRQFKRYLKTTPQNYRVEHSLQYIRAFRFSGAPRKSGRS